MSRGCRPTGHFGRPVREKYPWWSWLRQRTVRLLHWCVLFSWIPVCISSPIPLSSFSFMGFFFQNFPAETILWSVSRLTENETALVRTWVCLLTGEDFASLDSVAPCEGRRLREACSVWLVRRKL